MRRPALVLAVALAACGVRAEDSPRRLDDSVAPTAAAAVVPVTVYVPAGDAVTAARRLVVAPPTPERRVAATGVEVGAVRVEGRAATVEVESAPPLAEVAAVVLTLTADPAVETVTFVSDGSPVAVPRPGGAPTTAPLRAADVSRLVR